MNILISSGKDFVIGTVVAGVNKTSLLATGADGSVNVGVGPETLQAASGAIVATAATARFNSSGGALAMTMPNGTIIGQRKKLVQTIAGNPTTITFPASILESGTKTSITLTAQFDSAEIEWQDGTIGWRLNYLTGTAATA